MIFVILGLEIQNKLQRKQTWDNDLTLRFEDIGTRMQTVIIIGVGIRFPE